MGGGSRGGGRSQGSTLGRNHDGRRLRRVSRRIESGEEATGLVRAAEGHRLTT